MGTKSGKKIIKQGLFKSKGYRQFNQYKEEYETKFPVTASLVPAKSLTFS